MRKLIVVLLLALPAFGQLPDASSKVVDKKFLLVNLSGDLAMAFDYQYTRLNLDAGYRERNPLLGEHPSTGKMIGVGAAWSAGLWTSSYYLKKKGNRLWWLPRVVQAGINGYFAFEGSKNSRTRYTCTQYSTGERTCVVRP